MPFFGISTTAIALSGRLSKLRGQYVRLESQYRRLSTNAKRNLLSPFPEERFYVAAILQWEPGTNWFNLPEDLQRTDIEMTVTWKAGGLNEICPIWLDFFADLREVDWLLKEMTQTPFDHYIERLRNLLDGAESKADWVGEMLAKVTQHAGPAKFGQQQSTHHQYGYGGWNEMCIQVKGGALHTADVMCGHTGLVAPTNVLEATIKLFNGTAGIQSCKCGYDFSVLQPSILGIGERTAARRWFMVKPSMLPFGASVDADRLPACVGWLFTPYNHHGQEDPLRRYPFTPDLPASMQDPSKRKRIPKSDLPDVQREAWDNFVRGNAQYLTTASMMRAKAMSLSFSRQTRLPSTSETDVAVSMAASPTKSEKRMQTPQIFQKKDQMPGWIRGMPGWTPVASIVNGVEERRRRPHHDFNKKHAKTKAQSGRPTPQPSMRRARARNDENRRVRSQQSRRRQAAHASAHSHPDRSQVNHWDGIVIPSDAVGRYNAYERIWTTLGPEDTGIPYPGGSDLTPDSFSVYVTKIRQHQYPRIPHAHLAGIQIQCFFLSGHSVSFEVVSDTSSRFKLNIELNETDSHKVKALRKHLRRVESLRWHSDQINKRTGQVGILDEAIGREERVIVAYTACRDLLKVCEDYTRDMGWPV